MALRAIVVDDEALGRRGIVARLAKNAAVEVVAECSNGRQAIEAVTRLRPDLLFLDVQMPGLDGFAVVESLPEEGRPRIIFVTAHDEHAVRAFEFHALDYLLKPLDDERFEEALRRAIAAIRQKKDSDIGRRVAAMVGGMLSEKHDRPPLALADRYVVRSKGKQIFVRHAEIDWVEADGDYVRLHAGTRSWLLRDTLTAVERRLRGRRFLRIHRSTIVNLDRVQEMQAFDSGDCFVLLRNGKQLRLSRTYREAFEKLSAPDSR